MIRRAGIALALAVAVLAAILPAASLAYDCPEDDQSDVDLRPPEEPKFTLAPTDPKIRLTMDDASEQSDVVVARASVRGGTTAGALPGNSEVGADIESAPKTADRSLSRTFTIALTACTNRAGNVQIEATGVRDEGDSSKPGVYAGAVIVGGTQAGIEPITYPIEVSIKSESWIPLVLAVLAALIGVLVGIVYGKPQQNVDRTKRFSRTMAVAIPVVLGIAVGFAAAYWGVYATDSDWGSSTFDDYSKLALAGFFGATGAMSFAGVALPNDFGPRRPAAGQRGAIAEAPR